MSVREFPSKDSETRHKRAEQCNILDIREISGDSFNTTHETVYEIDVVNERGVLRENVTIIPRVLFESTKDVQHRHDRGIVGKYSRALALESDEARRDLLDGIDDRRDDLHGTKVELNETDSRLLHTKADLDAL